MDNPPFSSDVAKDVVEAWYKLEGNYADIMLAARHAQEIHMGGISDLPQNARGLLSENPVFGEEIAILREVGAWPHYGGP